MLRLMRFRLKGVVLNDGFSAATLCLHHASSCNLVKVPNVKSVTFSRAIVRMESSTILSIITLLLTPRKSKMKTSLTKFGNLA